jgi:putative membrane-bound dehydrogenase-like protein
MIRLALRLTIILPPILHGEDFSWPSGDDLTIDMVASHPVVAQPIFLNFDHRGRMWVAQYRQYPFPAGSTVVGKDRFWRSEYDKLPSPPGSPDYVPGKDRISIHEDTNGDGFFDKVSSFLDGLNFCTSFAHDHDGLWVLQPPYLLFYEDKNHDDQSDGPPTVHLRGFGIEDSHSLANSLTWGPDGWLYGANGSTTSLRVTVEGKDAPPVVRAGQLIWRYHPARRVFEIFAEGGGNNLSCEFDAVGRLYSGSNTRHVGFRYHQGAYYQKTFGKHGALSNPHTYGYLPGILHQKYARVTNSIIVYEGGALPSRFDGAMVFANPLTLGVGSYRPKLEGLNFSVTPNGIVEVSKDDKWFCPVYVDSGPDGALYVCDWYDEQCNHLKHSEGQLHANDGRLFRIRDRKSKPLKSFDLSRASVPELLEHLKSPNRWWREEARRILKNHRHREHAIPTLQKWLSQEDGHLALEALWCWGFIDDLSLPVFRMMLENENPHVRRWAIRLVTDRDDLTVSHVKAIEELVVREDDEEVLAQIASSAARMNVDDAFAILDPLMRKDSLGTNRSLSLLVWWAIEVHCDKDADRCVSLFKFDQVNPPLVVCWLIRRLASTGDEKNFNHCAWLFRLTGGFSDGEKKELWDQFNAAFEGRSLAMLSDQLKVELYHFPDLPFHLRLRVAPSNRKALERALKILEDPKADRGTLLRLIEYFGEVPHEKATPLLIKLIDSNNPKILDQIFASLQGIDSPVIGEAVLARLPTLPPAQLQAAGVLLLSRASWVDQWLDAAVSKEDLKSLLTPEVQSQIKLGEAPGHLDKLKALFPEMTKEARSFAEEIARLKIVLAEKREANVRNGHTIFSARCAACHELHAEGGKIGPSLTSYQREDLRTLIPSIVQPGREIREGFENYTLKTRDGRTLVGFLKSKTPTKVVLQPAGGAVVSVGAGQILTLEPSRTSLMPPGLLSGLSDQELIDFFTYLRSPQPLNLPGVGGFKPKTD